VNAARAQVQLAQNALAKIPSSTTTGSSTPTTTTSTPKKK
jgi:hypothetical protein